MKLLSVLTALKSPDSEKRKDFFHPECHIEIRSLFGVIDVPISKTICNFLRALPREPFNDHIFTMPWRTLLRTLQRNGVVVSPRARVLGKITFLTFMSPPHEGTSHLAWQRDSKRYHRGLLSHRSFSFYISLTKNGITFTIKDLLFLNWPYCSKNMVTQVRMKYRRS